MDLSPGYEHEVTNAAFETRFLFALFEEGIEYIRQGHYIEGVSCFTQAREHLSLDQTHFAAVIDAFIQSHNSYWQAQEALFTASKHFVEAESEQQKQLLALEKLLVIEEKSRTPLTLVNNGHSHNGQGYRPAQLLQIPSHEANDQPPALRGQSISEENDTLPGLYFACFGHFEVFRSGRAIALCRNRSGLSILRYLIARPGYRASRDTLIEVFWPEDAPEVARRKLQIAVSAVRCSLNNGYSCEPGQGYILCNNEFYRLNPAAAIQTDVDEFLSLWKAGQQTNISQAVELYERACQLRTGQFLVEDTYADWSFIRREQLDQIYLGMCHTLASYYLEAGHYEDAAKWANTILRENRCDEEAYRQLMRISIALGRRGEALRHYQRCERILAEELTIQPMPETVALLRSILVCENLPERETKNRANIERI